MERRIWQDGRKELSNGVSSLRKWAGMCPEEVESASGRGEYFLYDKSLWLFIEDGDAVAGGSRGVKRVLTTLLHKIGVMTISSRGGRQPE